MSRSGNSSPLRVHLITADAAVSERIRSRIETRSAWRFSSGSGSRIPVDADLVLIPADRCDEYLPPGSASPVYVAYGPARYLAGCFLRGCSDYLREPWDAEELELRLARFAAPVAFCVGDTAVRLLEDGRLVSTWGATQLSSGERVILEILARRAGRAVSRNAIFHALWGTSGGSSRLVDVYVSRLRRRLAEVLPPGAFRGVLRPARGIGYTLHA
ncbi:MAG: response regulator transcription factor [Spirochaetaceae bacterium]